MNKIFKVVWSKVKHCYVVVSEIAKNTTSGGARRCRVRKGALAATLVTAFLSSSFVMPNSVWAATLTPQTTGRTQYIAVARETRKVLGSEIELTPGNPDSTKYTKQNLIVHDSNGNVLIDSNKNPVTKEYFVLNGYEDKLYVERQSTILSDHRDVNGEAIGEYQYVIKEIMGGLDPETAPNVLATAQVVIQPTYHYDGTMARTIGGATLNAPDVSSYAAASNSRHTDVYTNADFVIEDIDGRWVNANSDKDTNKCSKVAATFNNKLGKFEYTVNRVTQYANPENGYYMNDGNAYVFLNSNGDLYTGTVYGGHNEILLTGVTDDNKVYTYWGTKNNDDNTLLSASKMTVGQLNKEFNVMADNDKKLAIEDIKRITIDSGAQTIGLVRNKLDAKDREVPVAGTISIATDSTYNGTDGKDIRINISNHEVDTNTDGSVVENDTVNTISLDVGSRVVANRGAEYDANNKTLSTISINGNEYVIAAAGGTGTMSSWIAKVGNENATISNGDELAFKAGSNVSLGLEGKTITVNATDTKVVSGSVVEGGSGLYNIDLQTNASTNNNITIRNLHDYYTTKATASNVGTNGANVHFDRNDDTNEYDLTFVGNGSATVSVDDNGRVVINADDKDTVTNLVAGHNVSFAINDPVIDKNGNRTYTINATNTYTVDTSISGNDLVFNRNDGDSFAVNFIAGGGVYNKTKSEYEDTYVQIGGKNGIKLETGSKVEGAGVPVVGSTDKALSGITINGENFKVPVIQANANPEGGTPQYYLTSLKIDNTLYGIVSEGSQSDLSVTTSAAADGSYTADNGIVELKMVDNYTGQASNQKIVIKDVASKAVVDEIRKVKFGVTDKDNKGIGLYKSNANGGVDTVLSEIAVSSIGGVDDDVQIQFGDTDSGFTVNAGSKVIANEGNYDNNGSNVLTKLEVNGNTYSIVDNDTYTTGVTATQNDSNSPITTTYTQTGTQGYTGISFVAGENVSLGLGSDNKTITISATDTYATDVSVRTANDGATVSIVQNNDKGNKEFNIVGEGSVTVAAVDGKVKISGIDTKYKVDKGDVTADSNQVAKWIIKEEGENGKSVGEIVDTDTKILSGKVVVDEKGEYSIQLQTNEPNGDGGTENKTIAIENLHDYYTTGLKVVTGEDANNLVLTMNNGEQFKVALSQITSGLGTMSSWNAQVVGETDPITIANNGTLYYEAGDNIVLESDKDNKITVATADEVTFDKVTVGSNVIIDNSGIVVYSSDDDTEDVVFTKNEVSVGGNKITNVADGVVSEGSKDAINGSQLHIAVNKLKSDITTNISELNNLSVTGGKKVNGKYHGWQLKDSSAKDENGKTVTKEYSDTTLDTSSTKVTVNEDGIRTLTVADTAGYGVVLDDIASASVVQQQIDDVNSTLVDHSTIINNHSQQIDNLSTTVNNHSQQINDLSTTVNNHSQQINDLSTTVNNHSQQIDNLSTTVNNHSQQINDLSSVVNTHTTQINNIDNRVSDIETNITNITGNQITSGNIANYQYDAQTGGSSSITLVTESNSVDDIVIAGLRDTTLVANGNNEGVVDADNTFGKTYTISDTNKNSVVLKDVASASKVSDLAGTVGAATKESLKESYKNTTYLQATKAEDGKEVATESLVEADVKLDAAIKANADLSYSNDVVLQNQIKNVDSRINQLGSKVNKVGAGAAALAALHPMDFDPDDKLQFSAGVGHYGGENAAALGAFYRPTEKVMFSVAGTMGNGEDMVNAGVTFALDKPNNVSNSRTAMAREIVDLREHVARQEQALIRQDQQIAQLVAMVNQLTGNTMSYEVNKNIIFPDIPENHWAYEYIHSLAAKGIIEGYPDGTFGGDRTMTRYEFATMLFKAMQNGVVLSEQIRQEFEKELGRIRVDRIKGADNDANKVERVRVNNYEDRDDYGSKIVQVKAGA